MRLGNLLVNAAYLGSKALTAITVGANKVWEGVSKYIKKVGTNEEYSEAIDIEGAPYEYEETNKEIEQHEEYSGEPLA